MPDEGEDYPILRPLTNAGVDVLQYVAVQVIISEL